MRRVCIFWVCVWSACKPYYLRPRKDWKLNWSLCITQYPLDELSIVGLRSCLLPKLVSSCAEDMQPNCNNVHILQNLFLTLRDTGYLNYKKMFTHREVNRIDAISIYWSYDWVMIIWPLAFLKCSEYDLIRLQRNCQSSCLTGYCKSMALIQNLVSSLCRRYFKAS